MRTIDFREMSPISEYIEHFIVRQNLSERAFYIMHISYVWFNHWILLIVEFSGFNILRCYHAPIYDLYQGRAVDPRTPEHSGVEVPTLELFWGWICSGIES